MTNPENPGDGAGDGTGDGSGGGTSDPADDNSEAGKKCDQMCVKPGLLNFSIDRNLKYAVCQMQCEVIEWIAGMIDFLLNSILLKTLM